MQHKPEIHLTIFYHILALYSQLVHLTIKFLRIASCFCIFFLLYLYWEAIIAKWLAVFTLEWIAVL